MKYIFSTLVLSLLTATCFAGRIYFVSPEASTAGAGHSWANATTLHQALSTANRGDEIWVKQGAYLTSSTNDRQQSFRIPAGVHLFGGFAGTEVTRAERNTSGKSLLSGDIGVAQQQTDNAYTVVVMESAGQLGSTLDGFIIADGFSRNFKEGFTQGNAGGGLYIMAAQGSLSNHMINNCRFENNKAHNGGAVFVDTGRPSFFGCIFTNNTADFNGGAVYNYGFSSEANPHFRGCQFQGNASNSGAGMTNNGTNGSASPLLIDCQFIDNVSVMNGAAIFNITNDNGTCELVMEGCGFVGNDSIIGDDVSGIGVSPTFAARAARNGGGNLRPSNTSKR
ncbi:MAG: hypothetical protein AAGA31_06275 [Bacteroidota bacterium]